MFPQKPANNGLDVYFTTIMGNCVTDKKKIHSGFFFQNHWRDTRSRNDAPKVALPDRTFEEAEGPQRVFSAPVSGY